MLCFFSFALLRFLYYFHLWPKHDTHRALPLMSFAGDHVRGEIFRFSKVYDKETGSGERRGERGEGRGPGEGRGARGEGRGVRALHQSNTSLIILQAELVLNTSCQPCFICLFVCLCVWFNKQFGWKFKSIQRYAPYFHTHTIANLNFKDNKRLRSNEIN